MSPMLSAAEENFVQLSQNPYPGRLIIIGLDEVGQFVQLYTIMGRSEGSRNRIFKQVHGSVRTDLADASKHRGDPALLIYTAMRQYAHYHVVSNGSQTDAIVTALQHERSFTDALALQEYEPDANFTPRISGICYGGKHPRASLSLIRRGDSGESLRTEWHYELGKELKRGIGYCIHTYDGGGDPLPSFRREPYPVPLRGTPEQMLRTYWKALNEENRVAIVAKTMRMNAFVTSLRIENRFEPVPA